MSEQLTSKQEIARQLREWYESGWIRGNTLKQKQAELLWAAIGSLTAVEPSARQCNHGAISPKGTMLYHGYVQPKANLWRCDVCKGIYEGNLTDPNTPGSQSLTLVGPSEPPAESPLERRIAMIECSNNEPKPKLELLFNSVEDMRAAFDFIRASVTKDAGECGACDKPGEHCANVHGICSRHGGRAHETSADPDEDLQNAMDRDRE